VRGQRRVFGRDWLIKGQLTGRVRDEETNSGLEGDQVLVGRRWQTALEMKLRHSTFDHAGIGSTRAVWHAARSNIEKQALIQGGVLRRADELEVVDSDPNEFDTAQEAQTGGSGSRLSGCLGHVGLDGVVGDEEAVGLLDHADGFLALQGVLDEALVGVDLVDRDLDLPALMIGADPVEGGAAWASSVVTSDLTGHSPDVLDRSGWRPRRARAGGHYGGGAADRRGRCKPTANRPARVGAPGA